MQWSFLKKSVISDKGELLQILHITSNLIELAVMSSSTSVISSNQ